MTDPVDRFFEREREAVPTLSPPPGLFDELQGVARRKRQRNTTMVSAAAAVVLAVVGTGAVLGAQNLNGSSTSAEKPAGPTAKVSVSASTTSAVTSTPVDASVPTDFTAWSVSFVGTNQGPTHGWALGGYSCGGQQCVAVLETTDGLASWHTLAKPATATQYGMSAGHATVRFQSINDGWMVGSRGVYATHDGGRDWHPVAALQTEGIDALEAWKSHVYAVGAQGSVLWVSDDPTSDTWLPQPGLDLPPAGVGTKDSISPEDQGVVSVVRSTGTTTTVRLSTTFGNKWRTLPSPCAAAPQQSARLFVVLDPTVSRFVCGNGQVWAVWFDGRKPKRDLTLRLTSTTGKQIVAESVAHASHGTVVAYQGAGLQEVLASGIPNTPTPGDFSYVGMTTDNQGIALAPSATNAYWITTNGALTWKQKSFG
ncbi:hypothetical protein acdb102_38500 [Acidothermaceae bacterium B102]|nr:hypothetical protein acdb102_38500 [Acidothermaceae bacterium B102]